MDTFYDQTHLKAENDFKNKGEHKFYYRIIN